MIKARKALHLAQFTIRVLKISICSLLKKISETRRAKNRPVGAIERNEAYEAFLAACYSCNLFSLSALLITETELKVMATLAMIGLNNTPKNG
jgi:hypothetical protein